MPIVTAKWPTMAGMTDPVLAVARPPAHPSGSAPEVVAAHDTLLVEAEDDHEHGHPDRDRQAQGVAEIAEGGHQLVVSFMRSTPRNASCGISTEPTRFIRGFPSLCFSR